MKCKVGQFISYIGSSNNFLDMKIKPDTGVIQKFIQSVSPLDAKWIGQRLTPFRLYELPDDGSMAQDPFKSIWDLLAGYSSYSSYSTAALYEYINLPGVYKFSFYGTWTKGAYRDFYYIQGDSPVYNLDVIISGMQGEPKFQEKIGKMLDTYLTTYDR